MPFPRVAEIIDMIALFLSQKGDHHGNKEDIRNFRSVCKDFAATGARYLFPTVSVMRAPKAFKIPRKIAEHSLLRLHVRTLIYYYDKVTIKRDARGKASALALAAIQMNHFQASGQDIRNFAYLLNGFPRLKRIEIRSLEHDIANGEWHGFATSMYKKVGLDYTVLSSSESALSILDLLGTIETLVLSNSIHVTNIRTSLPCFRSLRILKIANPGRKLSQWTVLGLLPVIEELEYISPYRYATSVENEVIKGLPTSLQTLRLQCVGCFDEYFPANLNILELKDVLFDLDAFPAALSRVNLSNVRLVGSDMTRWATVLLSLKPGSKLTVSGCFTICNRKKQSVWLDDDPKVAYLNCVDTVTTCVDVDAEAPAPFVGQLLMTILQSNSSKESPKAGLLRLLFEEHNRQEDPRHSDLQREADRQVSMSMQFETMLQELKDGG